MTWPAGADEMSETDGPAVVGSRAVVVGVGDLADDLPALRWAATEAGLLRASLVIIHAYEGLPGPERVAVHHANRAEALTQAAIAARSVIEQAVLRVRELSPDLPVSGEAVQAEPASTLLRKAEQAQLIVLGAPRRGALGSLLLGSTGQAVAERAACPVILARAESQADADARVVVGVDADSDDADSDEVLAFAFEHADRHRAGLAAVTCWKPDLLSATSLLEEVVAAERAALAHQLDQRLQPWRQRFPEVPVSSAVLQRGPVDGLVDAAANQRLLVVGRRGSHPVTGALLGAVNLGVLHRSHCPVAVVPVLAVSGVSGVIQAGSASI